MKADELAVTPGRAQPLGATADADGVNFSIYSEHATSVELLLFASEDAPQPNRVITLDASANKSFHFWHCYVLGARPGQLYAYRMDGPTDTSASGCRFNRNKVLIDPYALGNVNQLWDRGNAVGPQDNVASSMRSVVIDPDDYDWEDDRFPGTPMSDTVIYEMHVRGFTQSASSGVAHPGTFRGVVEKIPYLVSLGVTAVELLPIYDFDESQILRYAPDGTPLRNFWGYDPYGHFAPQSSYCVEPEEGAHLREFRDMVKALHKAGIEVILDVVYNHSSEGNQNGPTIGFRGQANEAYYHLVPGDKRYYMDYSGCGNTFNANHPVVTKYIIESLEYWVTHNHVDGFRFDLGSVLSRGPDGAPMATPPVLWNIELSRILSETKVIAEAWDAGGLYQVGRFPGKRWAEWNGPYRDDIRRFLRGEPGIIGPVATRIAGSEDLFRPEDEAPSNSINFLTCHDGFTLNDLVSYNSKHNEANGEQNRDGSDDNRSWNCGAEGPTDDPDTDALRARQVKNAAAILLLSRGVPMLLGGDEFRRTQQGNNNAYCQDNELSWYDWALADKNADMVRFFASMVAFRKRFPTLRRDDFYSDRVNGRGVPEIAWHGCRLGEAGWNDPMCRVLSFTLGALDDEGDLHVMLNMYDLGLDFELPVIAGRSWSRAIDTAKPSPTDILDPGDEVPVEEPIYHVFGRSAVVLISERPGGVATP
ncbi:MAG: glycogen debranching protein GlgX [Actinomycetota bacterium]|nr:glycogen debranching protein GlgX [Actinomycetota bacterium]